MPHAAAGVDGKALFGTVRSVESATPRSVRRRRRLAASLLSWSLTLASLATLAGGVLLAMTASSSLATSMAQDERVRLDTATWVISVIESTTGTPVPTDPAVLADALDDAALADLLGANLTGIFTDADAREIPLSQLAPGIPPQELGLPEGADLKLLPVLPDVSWLPQPLTWAALLGGTLAALLGLAAMFVAYPHQRSYVVARLGRWLLSASVVAVAVYAAARFAGPQFGLLGSYAAAIAADASGRYTPVVIAAASAGALLLLLAAALRRAHARKVSAEADMLEPRLPVAADASLPPLLPAPARQPSPPAHRPTPAAPADPVPVNPTPAHPGPAPAADPSWGLPALPDGVRPTLPSTPQEPPAPAPYWARPGWPQPIEGFMESELTREATEEELAHAALASCRAWTSGAAADPDDAEILHLVLEDRVSVLQMARLWARFDGLPRACANVIFAYSELTTHITEYSSLLGIPDWAVHNRIGMLRRGVQEKGVEAFAASLRAIYVELADTLTDPLAARERERLTQIADALRFAPAGAPA